MELLGDRVDVYLVLQEIVTWFSDALVHFICLLAMYVSPTFSTFSPTLDIIGLFKFSYSSGFDFSFLHD